MQLPLGRVGIAVRLRIGVRVEDAFAVDAVGVERSREPALVGLQLGDEELGRLVAGPTVELDAEFLQPENAAITRNLLVAARYGLSDRNLIEELQSDTNSLGDLPSFRRSYQLALVDSIHAAIEWDEATKKFKIKLAPLSNSLH